MRFVDSVLQQALGGPTGAAHVAGIPLHNLADVDFDEEKPEGGVRCGNI